jgi:hypothetical protein
MRRFLPALALMVVLGALFALALLLWWVLLPVAALLVLWAIGALALKGWRDARAVRRFRAVWGVQGKDLLIVYSNSPNWQSYIESVWLPRWGERAVLLNWSERARWTEDAPPEVELFRRVGGRTEFNPLAVVVPRRGPVRVIRFWRAFRDFKHDREDTLRSAEEQLARALAPRQGG